MIPSPPACSEVDRFKLFIIEPRELLLKYVTKTSMFSVELQAGRYLTLGILYATYVYSGPIPSRTGKQSIK